MGRHTLTFAAPELSTGAFEIKIQADRLNTGSGMKNGKLKGMDFFDVKNNPQIKFKSTKSIQTGLDNFELDGNFTIGRVTKQGKLTLTITGKGTGSGTINGIMGFDRKQYGMNSGIPFKKIADGVQVKVDLNAKRVSGNPVNLKSARPHRGAVARERSSGGPIASLDVPQICSRCG